MISVDGLTVEFGGSALFSDISFVINEKDRIALMEKSRGGKAVQVENSSLNLDDYEKMVLDFVPVFKEG